MKETLISIVLFFMAFFARAQHANNQAYQVVTLRLQQVAVIDLSAISSHDLISGNRSSQPSKTGPEAGDVPESKIYGVKKTVPNNAGTFVQTKQENFSNHSVYFSSSAPVATCSLVLYTATSR